MVIWFGYTHLGSLGQKRINIRNTLSVWDVSAVIVMRKPKPKSQITMVKPLPKQTWTEVTRSISMCVYRSDGWGYPPTHKESITDTHVLHF